MTVPAYSEVSNEDYGGNPSVTESRVVSAGTFALRRNRYFNEIGQGSLLSAEQQQVLVNLIQDGDFDAEQRMIAHNLRLVVDVAKRYADCGVALFDLVREGNLGLIHALEKFDVDGRLCFSTYATQCISQYIERAIMNQNNRQPDGAC